MLPLHLQITGLMCFEARYSLLYRIRYLTRVFHKMKTGCSSKLVYFQQLSDVRSFSSKLSWIISNSWFAQVSVYSVVRTSSLVRSIWEIVLLKESLCCKCPSYEINTVPSFCTYSRYCLTRLRNQNLSRPKFQDLYQTLHLLSSRQSLSEKVIKVKRKTRTFTSFRMKLACDNIRSKAKTSTSESPRKMPIEPPVSEINSVKE